MRRGRALSPPLRLSPVRASPAGGLTLSLTPPVMKTDHTKSAGPNYRILPCATDQGPKPSGC